MPGGIEAVGDVAIGTLAARAVEPVHGEGAAGHHSLCLNCGTALIGTHCHQCGQAGHVHRSLAAIWHDLAHGVFHFEGKIWRTLPMLAWRPGELTRRYVAGERARFVSPMALFLFSVFLMFAIINAVGGSFGAPDIAVKSQQQMAADLDAEIVEAKKAIAALETRRAAEAAAGRDTESIDDDLADKRGDLADSESTAKTIGAGELPAIVGLHTGWAKLDKGIKKANANPGLLFYKLQSNAYKLSWALIPFSIPLVWLLFLWRRGYHLYDHAVFVTYSLSFMSLFAIVLTLIAMTPLNGGTVANVAFFIVPFHMYRQLRGAYRLSRFSAIWRTVALLWLSAIALLLFVLLLLGMGLLG